MTKTHPLAGVFAAALTPLDDRLEPDHAALIAHCRWLLAHGCDGVAVLGTTGEANSFGVFERLRLIEAVGTAGLPRERLMIGTGCLAIPDTVELTRAAVAAGAGGILMLPPFYYKGVSDDGLFAYYARVIERVADRRLQIYVYHFPKLTGIDLAVGLIVRLHRAYPETIVGMKDSSGEWANMQAVLQALPGFALFSGTEVHLLATLRAGGAGTISATANLTAPLCARVYAAWRGGAPEADALQAELTALRQRLQAYPAVASLKEAMVRLSQRAAWRGLRPPLTNLNAGQVAALFADLDRAATALPA
ncbi:MAG: dihydrodipicolinate synthase family protein, partial [Alphaproteobacteria bacterium]|nr:dihydrodipicolinate synthase family protein [Alphaproteobacteria bacterium]